MRPRRRQSLFDVPWFRRLPPHLKALWFFLRDHASPAGVVKPDLEAAAFAIKFSFRRRDLKRLVGLKEVGDGNYWFADYVAEEYGFLSLAFRPQKKVVAELDRLNLSAQVKHLLKPLNSQPKPNDGKSGKSAKLSVVQQSSRNRDTANSECVAEYNPVPE